MSPSWCNRSFAEGRSHHDPCNRPFAENRFHHDQCNRPFAGSRFYHDPSNMSFAESRSHHHPSYRSFAESRSHHDPWTRFSISCQLASCTVMPREFLKSCVHLRADRLIDPSHLKEHALHHCSFHG